MSLTLSTPNPEVNMEAAQLVVGAALIDSRFREQLFSDRPAALQAVNRLAVTPSHVRLTARDQRTLEAIPGATLGEFARGVERLRREVRPAGTDRPATLDEALAG